MSNEALEQPPVSAQTMVHEDNGLYIDENGLYSDNHNTKARFDKIFTIVQCDKDTFTKAQNRILTPELIRSFQTNNVGRWKTLGLPQCLVVLHYPDYTVGSGFPVHQNPNTLYLCIHTKNYDVLWCGRHFFVRSADDIINTIKWDMKNTPGNTVATLVRQHELHCRILQNTRLTAKCDTQLQQHRQRIDEQEVRLNQVSGLQKKDTHTQFNDVRNQQRKMQNQLVQHTRTIDQVSTTMAHATHDLQECCNDAHTRLTAQATVSEMHQNRLDTLQADIERIRSTLLVLQNTQSAMQATLEADIEARCDWSTELVSQLKDCEASVLVLQNNYQTTRKWMQTHHNDNKWLCIYVAFACVLLYQYIVHFTINKY